MNTICLVMIVKNEAARLRRCLASVLPHVDRVMIVDTGSADATMRIARDTLLEWDQSGVKWQIDSRAFHDFAHNRNHAIRRAEYRHNVDYLLMLDADMTLVGDPTALRKCSTALGMVPVQDVGGSRYWLPLLRKSNTDLWYEGRTHETIPLPATPCDRVAGVTVMHHADGGSRADKLTRDLRLLDLDLADNPNSTRATFYRAQTLLCLGRVSEAADAYNHRISQGGWDEEVWYSHLQLARCRRAEEDPRAYQAALLAAELRPHRAEPFADLACWADEDGLPSVAEMFRRQAVQKPWPCEDTLFVEPAAWIGSAAALYRWAADHGLWPSALNYAMEATVCAQAVGDKAAAAAGLWGQGKARWELGERDKAMRAVEAALRLTPENGSLQADAEVMRRLLDDKITSV